MSGITRKLRGAIADPAAARRRAHQRTLLVGARIVNRLSRRPVTGDAPVVVNLTSYGHRVALVFAAIESIARGSVRPRRLILWLNDESVAAAPPAELERLRSRGLEILVCPNYGPHTKQFAYASAVFGAEAAPASGAPDDTPPAPVADPRHPLVAADDDVVYPRRWLAGLLDARRRYPDDVLGYRAHTMAMRSGRLAPYSTWRARTGTEASFAAMATGVSGILCPPALLRALAAEGEAFRDAAPLADDVWVCAVSVRAGIRARQIGERQAEFPAIPGTQSGTLYRRNVVEGGNDSQIAASFGPDELRRIAGEADVVRLDPAEEVG